MRSSQKYVKNCQKSKPLIYIYNISRKEKNIQYSRQIHQNGKEPQKILNNGMSKVMNEKEVIIAVESVKY